MPAKTIEIPVRLDSATFQEFALFDVMHLRKRWRNPVLFAVLMTVFACICFALKNDANQAILLGCVLLGVGLLLPLVYFFSFFRSVREQAKKMKLDAPRHAYTVLLQTDGVTARMPTDPPQTRHTPWEQVYGAWRCEHAIYLYETTSQALLLPNGQANARDDAVWACLQEHLGPDRCHEGK